MKHCCTEAAGYTRLAASPQHQANHPYVYMCVINDHVTAGLVLWKSYLAFCVLKLLGSRVVHAHMHASSRPGCLLTPVCPACSSATYSKLDQWPPSPLPALKL